MSMYHLLRLIRKVYVSFTIDYSYYFFAESLNFMSLVGVLKHLFLDTVSGFATEICICTCPKLSLVYPPIAINLQD